MLYVRPKLRSIDNCQNGKCADHYQKTNNVGSDPLRYTIWHPLTIITWLYRGLIFLPIEVTFFLKFSTDILFDHGLNSVFWAKPHSLENLSILDNLAISCPYTDYPTFRLSAPQAYQCSIPHFLASLRACNLILYIHILINWQLSKQCIRWPVSPDRVAGSGIDLLSSSVFFSSYPLTSCYFSNIVRSCVKVTKGLVRKLNSDIRA